MAQVVLLGTAPASAHTQLTGSDPADGARIGQLPVTVVVTYSEDIAEQFVTTAVITPDGTTVPTSATVDGPEVRVDLSAPDVLARAEQGGWQVVARVVSVDGHPVEGVTTFELIGPAPGATAAAGAAGAADATTDATTDGSTDGSTDPAAALTDGLPRWAVVLGTVALVAAAGAALLVQLRRRPPQD